MGHSQIHDVGAMSRIIGGSREPMIIELNQTNDTNEEGFAANYFGFDSGAMKISNLSLITGKGFTGRKNIDSASVIINEATARLLVSNQEISDVIGQQLTIKDEEDFKVTIIGVVKDFHFQSMHQKIGPLVIGHLSSLVQGMDNILVKFTGNPKPVIDHLEELHIKFEPHAQITIDFMDDLMADIYKEDVAFKKIFTLGALLTMFIASLGIIGLSAYTAEYRNKEFGIRRILGASVMQVLRLQSRNFFLIVLASNLIAAPLTWWIFSRWLEQFSYRVTFGTAEFFAGSLILLLLSLTVVNLTSYASVKRNPAHSLRDE
jgi:putative ABC transport system permease protein